MSRSVSTPAGAELVAYQDWSSIDDQLLFDDEVEHLQSMLCSLWPSVEPESGWLGREDRVLAGNQLASFGLSEYCGLVAIWAVPVDGENADLAARWVEQIEPRFNRTFGQLAKLGTASNGEAFFRRIEQ